LSVDGLRTPVSIARDTFGIPHITASNDDDLFFAQGFVQAQDRLFQMDLWKRSVQGRLSEVLGANFIDRDAMTRRVQFRGDIEREWASYGPDTQRIARAFTNGINAWVIRARADLPEEFVLAGWAPELWKPEDLLNRTDAFLASGDAAGDLFRARLVAAIGASRVEQLLPLAPGQALPRDPAVDLSAITYVVPDTLRRIGTPAFFLTLAAPASDALRPSQRSSSTNRNGETMATTEPTLTLPAPGDAAWVLGAARTKTGAPLLAVQHAYGFDAPARRYLVHLTSPGLNVAGATSPWLPGVVVGHNERIAWGVTSASADTQDVFVERLNPANAHQVQRDGRWVDMAVDHERVDVKGRSRPFEYDRQYTPNGVVIALDRQRQLVYTLRWSGAEPGGAAELAAVTINRARSWPEFQVALSHWNMPADEFLYADVDGHVAGHTAGLVPARAPGTGHTVTLGWSSARGWKGWIDRHTAANANPPAGALVTADSAARSNRISAMLARAGQLSGDDLRVLQNDKTAAAAEVLVPLLASVRTVLPAELEGVRARLSAWNRIAAADSQEAHIYVRWDAAIRRLLATRLVPSEFVADFARQIDIVDVVAHPRAPWFAGGITSERDVLLIQALASAVEEEHAAAPGTSAAGFELVFAHPLAVFDAARRRFDVGPLPRGGSYDSVFAAGSRTGPTFHAIFDVGDWDRSRVIIAPGQSGAASSPHYDDLAALWSRGEDVPLPFSAEAVKAATREVLTLTPTDQR
jgi:penicillin amidase